MKSPTSLINSKYLFPDELVSNKEKDDYNFGKKFADAIYAEWFETNNYVDRSRWIDRMRAFGRGEHDMSYFKSRLCGEDLQYYEEYFNVDFDRQLKILPKFLNILESKLNDSIFEPKAYAIDPTSIEKKKKAKDLKMGMMFAKKTGMLDAAMNIAPEVANISEDIEDSLEEVEVNMALHYKEPLEKAEELLIKTVFKDTRFRETKQRCMRDLIRLGMSAARVWTDEARGIQVKYTDPAYFVHGRTSDPYFRDCKYFAEIKKMTVSELKKISKIELTDEMIYSALKAQYNEHSAREYNKNLLEDYEVEVMFFTFETFHDKIYKKKYYKEKDVYKLIDKTDTGYDPKHQNASPKITDSYTVWYEGAMLLCKDNPIISYSLVENMAEYDDHILPPYVVVAPEIDEYGRLHSILERAIDPMIELQFVELKRQQLVSELRPSIVDINIDSLIENELNGDKIPVKEQLAMFYGRSIRLNTTRDAENDPILARGIDETPLRQNSNLERLLNQYQFLLNQIRDVLGFNEFTDGSTPNPKTLVKVQEIARLTANESLKKYVDCALDFSLLVAENISSRLNDVFKYSKAKEKYIRMVGKDDISVIEKLDKERPARVFGVMMDYVPTHEEFLEFQNQLTMARQEGTLDIEDISILQDIENIRIAKALFRIKRRKYKEEKREDSIFNMEYNAKMNAQSAQMSEEAKRETEMLKHQLKLEAMNAELYIYLEKQKALTAGQIAVDNNDFKGRIELEYVDAQAKLHKDMAKKEKDEETRLKAIDKSAINQSKLITQRKTGVPPLDFRPFVSDQVTTQQQTPNQPFTP